MALSGDEVGGSGGLEVEVELAVSQSGWRAQGSSRCNAFSSLEGLSFLGLGPTIMAWRLGSCCLSLRPNTDGSLHTIPIVYTVCWAFHCVVSFRKFVFEYMYQVYPGLKLPRS
jgi:hypothetical protein